jgi:hypothetical protein
VLYLSFLKHSDVKKGNLIYKLQNYLYNLKPSKKEKVQEVTEAHTPHYSATGTDG